MSAYGIDVSSQQPADVDRPGIDFTVIKATEGHTYANPNHDQQVATARAAGHVVGHYHFLWPGNLDAQAAWFVQQAKALPGDILAVDWEACEDGSYASGAEKDQFISLVQQAAPGHKVILYCNRDYWLNHDTTSDAGDGLWIADPNSPAGSPAVHAPWVIHQYGEDQGVDLNVFNGDANALREFAGLAAAQPAPAPSGPAWPGEYLKLQTPMLHDDNVRTWQQQMANRGWSIVVDGWFGPASAGVCRDFQQDSTAHGWPLTVDGIVGPQTWRATWDRPVS